MTIKIGSMFSAERAVPVGSPQGSILGKSLFCVAPNGLSEQDTKVIDRLHDLQSQHGIEEIVSFDQNGVDGGDVSSNNAPISRPAHAQEEEVSSDDSFDFQYFNKKSTVLNDTDLSQRCNQDKIDRDMGVSQRWVGAPLSVR